MYVFSMFFQIGNLFCNKLEQTFQHVFQHVFNVFVFLIAIHLAVRNNMSKLSQHGGVRGTDDFHHFINFHRKRSAKICISGVYLYPLSAFFLQPPTHVIVRRLKDMSQHYETVSISQRSVSISIISQSPYTLSLMVYLLDSFHRHCPLYIPVQNQVHSQADWMRRKQWIPLYSQVHHFWQVNVGNVW